MGILTSIRIIAKYWSLFTLGFVLLFIIGEGIKIMELSTKEAVGLLMFPVGLLTGLFISWRKEIPGSIISIISMIVFIIVIGINWIIIVLSVPGLLFLLHGILDKSGKKQTTS